jgi:hypothetical protein
MHVDRAGGVDLAQGPNAGSSLVTAGRDLAGAAAEHLNHGSRQLAKVLNGDQAIEVPLQDERAPWLMT